LTAVAAHAVAAHALAEWLARRRSEAGLTLRMSAAGLISFGVAHLIGLSQVYWAVLTAIIVMQARSAAR
jgi:uncharacterized membrane protein YccC